MILAAAAAAMLAAAAAPPSAVRVRTGFTELHIREQVIIRVPVRGERDDRPAAPRIEWKEAKGPKCLAARSIVGASLAGADGVDMLLRDNSRVRAKLDNSCPALDYYIGFYIRPGTDGLVCADRDAIRSRVGGECGIEKFRALKPHRAR